MRKFTFLLAISLGFSLAGLRAQHILDYIGTEYPGADTTFFFEEAFVELDTSSYLTTGFLWDRTSPNLPLHLYNGTSSAEGSVDAEALMQGYLDVRGAAVQPTALPDYDSLVKLSEQLITGYDAIPIMVLDLSLNRIKGNAFDQGQLSFSNGVLHVDGGSSPFEEIDVFMAGMLNQTFPLNDTFNIVAPYLLYCGTNNQGVSNIRIDMKDGNGWQNLTWNQPQAFYLTGEEVEFDFEIEVTYSDQSVKISKNKGYKKSTGCNVVPPEEAPWGGETVTFSVPYITIASTLFSATVQYSTQTRYVRHHLSSTDLYGGQPGRGKVYVRYRNGAGQPKKFSKPVIVVEGIDFGHALPLVLEPIPWWSTSRIDQAATNFSYTTRLGSFGWPEMFGCSSNDYPNAKMPDFVDSLYNNDNDLILLDFKDGADYIQRNALLLKELINRVNQNKVGNEEIVIVAVSMGGQVTRYALTQMEANDEDHCVRLFVSHDSPWRGAHIAASLQFFAKYFSELHNVARASQIISMLNRPAARQLLLYHYTNEGTSQNNVTINKERYYHWSYNGSGAHPLRQAFVNELTNLGDHPKKCRNIAVANGNSEGNQKFGAGAPLYVMNDACAGFDIRFNFHNIGRSDALVGDFNRNGSYRGRYFIYGMPNLAGVPGGYRDDLKELKSGIEEELPGICGGVSVPNALQEKYTFVPTISSLNIANAPWDAKASNYAGKNDASYLGNTHFEVYQAPTNGDEDHGQVTDVNIIWLMKQIRLGEKVLQTVNSGVLTKSWNNPTENGFLGSLDINSGGTLYLNAARPIYDFTDPYDPKPVQGSTSHVRIGGVCTSTKVINVNSGGKMILGDNNAMINKAYLYIVDGATLNVNSSGIVEINKDSKLIVENGGQATINSNGSVNFVGDGRVVVEAGGKLTINGGNLQVLGDGKITVEDGGELVYNPSSSLQLGGYGALFEIKGKLSIGNNADFTFSGNGRLVFDQDVKWGVNASGNPYLKLDEYWDIGSNSTFTVEGPSVLNQDHFFIEAFRPVYFKTENGSTFDQVTIRGGRVVFHQDALLFCFGPTDLRWVKFQAAYSWQTHGGFRLWNNPGPNSIFGCKFYDGVYGAAVHWVGGGSPIAFTNCDFANNDTALKVMSGNFNLYGCDFNDNYQAVSARDLTGQSLISGTKVIGSNNAYHDGVYAHAQNGASLTVNSSEFSNCINGLHLGADMSARVYCSEFTLNGRYGILAGTSSSLDIGSEAENVFAGNQWHDIYLTGNYMESAIYMDEGRNDFAARGYQGGSYLKGRFSDGKPVFLGSGTEIPANNNKMPIYLYGGLPYMPVNFTYKLTAGGTIFNVTLAYTTNLNSVQRECTDGVFDDPGHTGLYRVVASFLTSGGIINNIDYANTALQTAALDAIDRVSFGEDIREDDEALVKLTGILDAQVSSPDAYTNRIRSAVYQQMHQALSNAYQNGGLVNVQGEDPNGVNDTVDDVITVIDQFIGDIDPNDTTLHFLDFKYHLDKAHAYRVSGYYDEALAVLQTSQNWTYDYDQTQQAGYWECVCTAEKAYFDGELPQEEYSYQMESCNQQFYGNNYKRSLEEETPGQAYLVRNPSVTETANLFPQPVQESFSIEISPSFAGQVPFTINDLSGKTLKEGVWKWEGSRHQQNVSDLVPGAYLLQMWFGENPQAIKFMKK